MRIQVTDKGVSYALAFLLPDEMIAVTRPFMDLVGRINNTPLPFHCGDALARALESAAIHATGGFDD